MTDDDEAALRELLELPDEPIHGVVWGPVLEDLAPSPEEIAETDAWQRPRGARYDIES